MNKIASFLLFLGLVLYFEACQFTKPVYPLDNLQGQWLRVTSNNSRLDSMQILIQNDSAIITATPLGSSFVVGQKKWQNIISTIRNRNRGDFTLYDLSGNHNSYEATIFILSDSSFELKNITFPNAPGAVQQWVKN